MTKTTAVDSSREYKESVERSNRGVIRDPSSKQVHSNDAEEVGEGNPKKRPVRNPEQMLAGSLQ
jgi:hypothetical protein